MRTKSKLSLGLLVLAGTACGTHVDEESTADTRSVAQPQFADLGCETQDSAMGWRNGYTAITPSIFQARFDMTAYAPRVDAVVGLSNGPADAFTDLAAIVRLNDAGTIDVRKGSVYAADRVIAYEPGVRNSFRLLVNVTTHTYDVEWRNYDVMDEWIKIADDYPFRTEQSGVARLDNIARIEDSGAGGSFDFCFHSVTSAACGWSSAGEPWKSYPVPGQSGRFLARFDAWSDHALTDVVYGLSRGPADAFTDLGPIVRFNPSGYIDARDGSTYRADVQIPYGATYGNPQFHGEFLLDIDVATRTYSAGVRNLIGGRAQAGPFQTFATNYRFRSEQSLVSALDHFGFFNDASVGTVGTCHFAIDR